MKVSFHNGLAGAFFVLGAIVACGGSSDTTSAGGDGSENPGPGDGVDAGPPPSTCEALAPSEDHLFALSVCDGLGGSERVCLFRQDNCDWTLQCGAELSFEGSVIDGAGTLGWFIEGSRCTARFVDGRFVGSCEVGGSCALSEVDAVAGGDACPALPTGSFRTRGCGGVSAKCTGALQHGCTFMAACSIGPVPDLVVAGDVSRVGELGHIAFNGANGWQCYADEPSAEQLAAGEREPGEWRGTCETETGRCRESGGYHGLQIFFDGE